MASGNLQNPTQMLSYDGMKNQPLHLAEFGFSSNNFIYLFSPGLPEQFRKPWDGALWMNGLDVVCPWPHILHSQRLNDMDAPWSIMGGLVWIG